MELHASAYHDQDHHHASRPLRRRGGGSALRLLFRAIAIALVVLLIVAVGAVALLISGPQEIGLVRNRVVEALEAGLGSGYTVQAGKSVLDVDPLVGGLVLRVDEIVVTDSQGSVVVQVPSTRFAVNPLALLTLRVEINAVELSEPEVNFVRLADGSVRLGNLRTVFDRVSEIAPRPTLVESADGGFPDLIGPLRILDRGIEPAAAAAIGAGFRRLGMVDGTIVVWDESGGRRRRFPDSDLTINVEGGASDVAVEFATLGAGGRWTATLDRKLGLNGEGHGMTAVFSQLTIADLFPSLGGEELISADIPLYGRASIDFDSNGNIIDADARVDLGAGVISIEQGEDRILLDEATVRMRWDVNDRALIFDRSSFFFGDTRGSLTGRIQSVGEGADLTYEYSFVSPGAVFSPRDVRLPPLIARQLSVSGTADPRTGLVHIENASLVTDEGSVAAVGSLGFEGGDTPSLAMAATASPMSISALKRMWTPLISHGARRWAVENMISGRVTEARFEASVPAGKLFKLKKPVLAPEEMQLFVRAEDAVFRTIGDLPPVKDAAANIVLSGITFGVDLEGGVIETDHGTVTVDAGAFAIPDASQKPASGVVEMQISGSAPALAAIADSDPINALSPREIAPTDLSGSGTATISVRLPLMPEVTEDDVDWKVVVDTDGVSSQVPVDGRKISDADVAITVTPAEATVYGEANIDGVPAEISMALPTDASRDIEPGARLVRLILDDAARKKLGIGLENMLSGSITALVSDNEEGGQHYEFDLQRARLTIPGVGWTKGVGVPAQLSFDIEQVSDGHDIKNLVFRGDGFGFHGIAKLDPSYALLEADIGHMALREGDAVSVRITRGSVGYAVNTRGESLNLQGLISQVRDRYEQSGGFPDLALNAEIDRLVGFNQETIDNASVRLVSVGGETQKLSFTGSLGGTPISLDYAITPQGTTLLGGTENTGRLMRFADVYTRMEGGVARLEGQSRPGTPMLGTFDVSRFSVLNEPAMEQVVSDGTDGTGGGFNPREVVFQRLVARFTKTDRAVTIEDALLRGAQVGATFSGRYDVASTNVALTGTYLPAYAVNNLFSKIPILGLALGGGFREGLIGVTFKIEGPLSSPSLFFNPLSAVAPGIFRKIFEFQQGPQQRPTPIPN